MPAYNQHLHDRYAREPMGTVPGADTARSAVLDRDASKAPALDRA